MIVNPQSNGWEIIFQRAHGMLAAQIAFHWENKNRPSRWVETLLAIAGHDDAQIDFKGSQHISPAGSPLDFTMRAINLHQPKSNSDYAMQKSRWIGLLNSLHISFLYAGMKGKDKRLDRILGNQVTLQKQLLKSLKISRKEAEASYRLLEWCDALSLILCRNLMQPEERKMEISKGPSGSMHQVWQKRKSKSLVVEPWCFEKDFFEVRVETRLIRQLSFKNDDELETLLKQSPVKEKKWRFEKNPKI